jgi:phosphoenolpyruvate-protein kinase (PTS system EI component)
MVITAGILKGFGPCAEIVGGNEVPDMANHAVELRLQGLGLSPGLAVGRACHLHDQTTRTCPSHCVDPAEARARLEYALASVAEHIRLLEHKIDAQLDPRDCAIIDFYRRVLADPQLRCRMLDDIEQRGVTPESAIRRSFGMVRNRLQRSANEYLRERASDLAEIECRLVHALCDSAPFVQCAADLRCRPGECTNERDHIVIAREATPAAVLELESVHTLGFISERGGPTSHAAILLRALGRPAVGGLGELRQHTPMGSRILVDGDRGEVIVNPSERSLERAANLRRAAALLLGAVRPIAGFQVLANINRASEVDEAVRMDAEGIGLYRTETELLARGRPSDEEEQYELYAAVLASMGERPVYIRLFDLGADKAPRFLDLPPEDNPQLGCRGARLLLSRCDLLRPQARAIARASRLGPVRVVYPMITSVDRFLELRNAFQEMIADVPSGRLLHGVLLEVPAACLQAAELLAAADFACIGTNDLVQYLFAADRNNKNVASDYLTDSPVLWSLLADIARAAGDAGKELTICGELAGDPENVERIVHAGISVVSVAPKRIPGVRRAATESRGPIPPAPPAGRKPSKRRIVKSRLHA